MNISQPHEEYTIGEEELFLSSFILRQEEHRDCIISLQRRSLCVQEMGKRSKEGHTFFLPLQFGSASHLPQSAYHICNGYLPFFSLSLYQQQVAVGTPATAKRR
jgi:hypothetical protein